MGYSAVIMKKELCDEFLGVILFSKWDKGRKISNVLSIQHCLISLKAIYSLMTLTFRGTKPGISVGVTDAYTQCSHIGVHTSVHSFYGKYKSLLQTFAR